MGLFRILKNRNKVLGLNARYLDYIRPYNLRRSIKIADDKVLTKKVLKKADIPTPELIAVIRNERELYSFDFDSLPSSFVIKPVHGIEGGGIEIFYNRKNGYWIKSDKTKVSVAEMQTKMREILQGRYSLHNQPDKVMIEERVKPHKVFRYYTYKGTPDIRVIVFNGVPIMGMVRLPTKDSQGRANLKLGAVGGAIDIAAGRVMTAVKGKSGVIEKVPHTGVRISGLRIPYWNRMLRYAVEAQRATNLGFASIDFLLDRDKGPVVVEMNARTGLSIQLADQEGMRERLERVKGVKINTVEQGIRLGKDMFGGEIQESIENISGKQVIGLIEDVKLIGKNDVTKRIKAKVDTGADKSSIDIRLARELGYGDALEYTETLLKKLPKFGSVEEAKEYSVATNLNPKLEEHEDIIGTSIVNSSSGVTYRIRVKLDAEIAGQRTEVNANLIDRSGLNYTMIIGKNDLNKFLIDSSK